MFCLIKRHIAPIDYRVSLLKSASQVQVIEELNPIIGW